jgi:hypothetical protein
MMMIHQIHLLEILLFGMYLIPILPELYYSEKHLIEIQLGL